MNTPPTSFSPFSHSYEAAFFPYPSSISPVFFSVYPHIPLLLIPESCVTVTTIDDLAGSIRSNIHLWVPVLTDHCVLIRNLYHAHWRPADIISHWFYHPLRIRGTYYLVLSIHTNYIPYPSPFP